MKNHKKYFWIDLIFILSFLNVWDFAINRTFINGMAIGLVMFLPATLLWFLGSMRAIVLVTLISILEFVFMLIFFAEGLQLGGGAAFTLKSVFWLPYLLMTGVNGYWGLKIYSEQKNSGIHAGDEVNFQRGSGNHGLKAVGTYSQKKEKNIK